MTVEVWMQSFIALGAKVDNLWSTYVVVQLGIFWFFFLTQRPLLLLERFIAGGAYGVFSVVNGTALINAYSLLEAFRSDGLKSFAKDFTSVPQFYTELLGRDYAFAQTLIYITHGGALAVVLLMIVFRNSMLSSFRRHYSNYAAAASIAETRNDMV